MELKPTSVRFHTGVQIRADVLTSIDTLGKHKEATLELVPFGVLIGFKGFDIVVPYANVSFIAVEKPVSNLRAKTG